MDNFADELKAEAMAAADSASQHSNEGASQDGAHSPVDSAQDATGDDVSVTPDTGSAQPSQERSVPLRALEDEREKRQLERKLREGMERRLEQLESMLAASSKPAEVAEPKLPYDKLYESPESVFEAHTEVMEKRLSAKSAEAAREIARAQFADYDETIDKLQSLEVPGLQEAIAKSASPPHTAYRMIKAREKELAAQANDPKVTALQQQLEATQKELAALRGEVERPPQSLSQARGASAGTAPVAKTVESVLASAWDKPELRGS